MYPYITYLVVIKTISIIKLLLFPDTPVSMYAFESVVTYSSSVYPNGSRLPASWLMVNVTDGTPEAEKVTTFDLAAPVFASEVTETD